MIKVSVNRETCEGYGNCVRDAPEVFDLGDDGKVTLLQAELPDDELARVRQASYDCPTDSISFVQEGESG
jgi:ferredoxin